MSGSEKVFYTVAITGGFLAIAAGASWDRKRHADDLPGQITATAPIVDAVVEIKLDLGQPIEALMAQYGAMPRRIPDGRTALIVGHCQDQPERICYGQIPQTR